MSDAKLTRYEHKCQLVIDKIWPGMNGKIEIVPGSLSWIPLGKARSRDIRLAPGQVSYYGILRTRWPWLVPPVAIYVGTHRLEIFLSGAIGREPAEHLLAEISGFVRDASPLESAIPAPDLHLRWARLYALFWLVTLSAFMGILALSATLAGNVSVLSAVILLVFVAAVVRTVITALPLLSLSRG
jgi:hypothetical protein